MKRLPRWMRWSLSGIVLVLSAWLLWWQLRGIDPAQLGRALASLPPLALTASLVATAISFLCLGAYERVATEWIAPGRIPAGVAWRTGLIAHAVANTLGLHPVTAVALRLERYRALGVDAGMLAKIVAAIAVCVGVGVAAILVVAGAWWLWLSGGIPSVSLLLLALALALHGWWARSRKLALIGMLGLVEMASALLAFTVLVPDGALPQGPALVFLFVAATVLGVVSHAPGGVGVFEATILAATTPAAREPVLAALLAYRVLYGLLPCALALLALAQDALRQRFSSTADTRA